MEIKDKAKVIVELNDAFRQTFTGGRVKLTVGVNALDTTVKVELLRQVR